MKNSQMIKTTPTYQEAEFFLPVKIFMKCWNMTIVGSIGVTIVQIRHKSPKFHKSDKIMCTFIWEG